ADHRALVLPDGLHRSERPPVALAPQPAERGRRLGPRAGILRIDDPVSAPADGQRQVSVLGERVAGDAADLDQDAAAERADGARHGGRALQYLIHAAVEVEPYDVLDVLPATEQAAAVADLGVARHRADGGVGERLHEVGDGVLLEHG